MRFFVTSQSSKHSFEVPESGPWSEFFRLFSKGGHELVSLDENPDVVVCMNNHPNLLNELNRRKCKSLKVLVLWEPKVTRPSNFNKARIQNFNKIFSPSQLWLTGSNVEHFPWPQTSFKLWKSRWIDWNVRSDQILAFQSNKFSFAKGEMYSLRREIVKELKQGIDFYGSGWGSPRNVWLQLGKSAYNQIRWNGIKNLAIPRHCFVKPPKNLGFTSEKMKLLLESKFSIVVENSKDYVSEKLFESAVTGNVAIYVGPKLSEFGIPQIAIEAQDDVNSIFEAIERARTDDELVDQIRETMFNYLSSDNYYAMQNDLVLKKLADRIINVAKEEFYRES
jgi:hypothetical protein